jgi:hypothetical protein
MYVVYGIIATCFQHFMSTLSKDLSDSAKEERIGRACNKSRRGDATRRLCIFPALFFFPASEAVAGKADRTETNMKYHCTRHSSV